MRYVVVLAAVAAVLSSVSATQSRAAASRGYPYGSRCPRAGVQDVVDQWGMYACNCTSYVAWSLVSHDQPIDWFIPGAMNAWNWPHVARLAGLRVDHRPSVGAIAAWPHLARPFGHVAYVNAVDGRGRIDVSEYNLPDRRGRQTYVFDMRRYVSTAGALFIHVPQGGE